MWLQHEVIRAVPHDGFAFNTIFNMWFAKMAGDASSLGLHLQVLTMAVF